MSEWKTKRFWKAAEAVEETGGWGVRLDGRPLKTPAKAALALPTQALAEAVASEWQAQEGEIDPLTMPFTRSANAAIDKVQTQFEEVAALIAAYGETDLTCYRADGPDELVALQAAGWDPLIKWAIETHGVTLRVTTGMVPVEQDAVAMTALAHAVWGCDAFALTALHDLVSLSGSLVIGLAAQADAFDIETLWDRSRIDEHWQESQWGVDEEAFEEAQIKRAAFFHAKKFLEKSALR